MEVPTAWRTYLMGAGIIVHQVLIFIGVDVPSDLLSETIDGILAIGAIFFRWRGAVATKKAVVNALYTPVPLAPKPVEVG